MITIFLAISVIANVGNPMPIDSYHFWGEKNNNANHNDSST